MRRVAYLELADRPEAGFAARPTRGQREDCGRLAGGFWEASGKLAGDLFAGGQRKAWGDFREVFLSVLMCSSYTLFFK